jgi:hypothetical protein
MIFLAVTLGFFAENIREHVADNAKEREYVLSMIANAATDTVNINKAVALNFEGQAHLDSLAYPCANTRNWPISKDIMSCIKTSIEVLFAEAH